MESPGALVGDRLSGLQDIPLPPPVPYVPQTLGWLIVALVLLLIIGFVVWRIVRHRRTNAYRREALAELALIERDWLAPRAGALLAVSAGALPALLKRTAIAATSRNQVAALSGDEWLRFLDRSLGGTAFEQGPGRLLPRIAYMNALPPEASPEQLRTLIALSRRWIRHHHADV